MQQRVLFGLSLVLLLSLGLAACGSSALQAEPTEVAGAVSAQASFTATATAIPASASPTPLPPSASPTPLPPSASPTPLPPSATPTLLPPSATPEPVPPTDAPSPSEEPATATLTPLPTATPEPAPTFTPTTVDRGTADLADIRLELQEVVDGLEAPVGIAHAGDGSGRLFVVEKTGRIRVVQDGALLDAPFLDIGDRVGSTRSEQGLLGLAFHPDYAANGSLYVNYTDRQGNTVVSRFQIGSDPRQADAASETILLTLAQPADNHNGGHLAFGPEGYLYIGTGDGGAAGDKFGNGQNGSTLLGAMLRLDVDGGQPYAVPADNPFVGDAAVRDEIWAIGLRNPWRYAFDRLTGDLYIADVGQNRFEEVNVQAAGRGGQNYGWPIMEGVHCYPEDQQCDRTGLTLPVAEYDHVQGCSVTGGYVYRGQEFPLLIGVYVFGDYCSGRIWGLAPVGDGDWQMAELAHANAQISSFGEDEGGELYLVDMGQGGLFKVGAYPRE